MSETTPISVIAVDIDASGSESSAQILTALRTHLRGGDVLFEQSRTRFVIILSATPQAGAQAMAQRMASEIRPLHRILVRIGVATATGTTDDVRALVHRAFSDLRHISPATSLG
ncbi:MAG: diguanylate cyclase [Acidobacteria bacterium]|nr:diguanylate cyclase [Acidobacteriota bacterium]